ncbi:MAG: D-alanine-D-alanine ligase, partial [Pirellulaceae bacterium]
VADSLPFQMFRREPERLFGEGIGCSRAPIASLLFALKSLRSIRALRSKNLGVLFYCDEGRDCRYSQDIIRAATKAAKRVIVLKPGNLGEKYVTGRRGQGTLKVCFQGKPTRLGKPGKRAILTEVFRRLDDCMNLSDAKTRISVGTLNIQTENLPMMLPHRVDATIMFSFPDQDSGSQLEKNMREILLAKGLQVRVDRISIRPPMLDRGSKSELRKTIESIAKRWEIPLKKESSAWPSVGGLAPEKVDVICGVGPVCHDIYRPEESVERISLVQRTLLLAELLLNVGNS